MRLFVEILSYPADELMLPKGVLVMWGQELSSLKSVVLLLAVFALSELMIHTQLALDMQQ